MCVCLFLNLIRKYDLYSLLRLLSKTELRLWSERNAFLAYLLFSSRLIINPTVPSLPLSPHQTCSIISICNRMVFIKANPARTRRWVYTDLTYFVQKKSLIQLYDLGKRKLCMVSKRCHMVSYSICLYISMILIEKPLPNISFSLPGQIITCCQP